MDRQAVFELIRDRLADILEVDPARITEAASFADDLDADSRRWRRSSASGRWGSASTTRTWRT